MSSTTLRLFHVGLTERRSLDNLELYVEVGTFFPRNLQTWVEVCGVAQGVVVPKRFWTMGKIVGLVLALILGIGASGYAIIQYNNGKVASFSHSTNVCTNGATNYPICNNNLICQYGGTFPNCNSAPSCQYGGAYPNCSPAPGCQSGGTYPN